MKKVILSAVALIFAIAMVLGGYLLLSSRNLQTYAVEEGTSCPYFWQEQRDGTYRLKIDATEYPDNSWSIESYPKNVVAVTEVSSKEGMVTFSILPLNMGQTYVQVRCEQTDPITVRVFEIDMQISVAENGQIVIEKTEHKDYAGITTMGEEETHPIQWWTAPEGAANLLIAEEGGSNWEALAYDPNSMDVSGPFYRQGSCGFEIRGKQTGVFPLTIYNGAAEAILLEIEVTEDLAVTIADFTVGPYAVDRSEEHAALETEVGRTLVLPAQATVTGYAVNSGSGSVDFVLNDQEWSWQLSTKRTAKDIVKDIIENASETETAYAGGRTLTAYKFKDGVAVCWNMRNCAMALQGEREATIADALAVAGLIVEANNG